jgi:succinylglutamic semialdehyde dehydrogenase
MSRDAKSHFIDGEWIEGAGEALAAENPTTGEVAWAGRSATADEMDGAVDSARRALASWSDLGLQTRIERMLAFAEALRQARSRLIEAISVSTGKPLWESATEADAMVNKIGISIDIETKRSARTQSESGGIRSATRFKPHGVCAVIGPFNFPGHLPNGHIVPALLAGNTVVYKPSELTPLVAQLYTQLLNESGLPTGVFSLLQGGGEVGKMLTEHPGIDGIFFTGSRRVGVEIAKANVERTGRILALEMGGNNPLVVHKVADLKAAAYAIIQSAFITAGQRCSCARRLIVLESEADAILNTLKTMTQSLMIGPYTSTPEPFIGPVISTKVADRALESQKLLQAGRESILEVNSVGPRENFLSPGIVDATGTNRAIRSDSEIFAPLLEVVRVKSFDDAIAEANDTKFGLAAGLLCDDRSLWERFFREIRAGVVNWNRPTTGASSALPFGGIGDSGNHRPSAAAAAEYCSFPIAVMESDRVSLPAKLLPGVQVG